jgi:hypothetical protein
MRYRFSTFRGNVMPSSSRIQSRSTNPGSQVVVAAKFYRVASNICDFLAWNLLHAIHASGVRNIERAPSVWENLCASGLEFRELVYSWRNCSFETSGTDYVVTRSHLPLERNHEPHHNKDAENMFSLYIPPTSCNRVFFVVNSSTEFYELCRCGLLLG